MKPAKAVGIQYAALPYRVRGRRVEILLITSRETRRWIIPKGWPIKGLSPPDGAAREAAEEAGLIGSIESKSIGSYKYLKALKGGERLAVQVIVFPLKVKDQLSDFREANQREMAWQSFQSAAVKVTEPGLRRLVREFGRSRRPGLLGLLRLSLRRRDVSI